VVGIDLTIFELGDSSLHGGANSVRDRLAQLQLAQIVHRRRAMILFDGLDGAGRHASLCKLAAAWDPCHCSTLSCEPEQGERHWLARYWAALPAAGDTALFHGSWYRQTADERAFGRLTDKAWARRGDEINEFEAQQRDHGTLLVKLFFRVSSEVQAERLAARDADPWRRWLAPLDDRPPFDDQLGAWTELLETTDTRWAPWTTIDANGADSGVSAALAAVTRALEKAIPLDPPSNGDKIVPIGQYRSG
jgi:polyphosphate kinase 2 (PPK2 family)